jgi:TetR/AcrR family transcriptional repressor of bet genes
MARKRMQHERKKQILWALDTCLQEKSFQQTSIKDIARVAGVNHGVLHYYFTNKEDILLHYIDYVIEDYQSQVRQWLGSGDLAGLEKKQFIEEIFAFINNRITLNQGLSRIFIEIWEIGIYHQEVREKLQHAYSAWIAELTSYLSRFVGDENLASTISIAMVAFWEGMALFSTIFDAKALNIAEVLDRFQGRILEIL